MAMGPDEIAGFLRSARNELQEAESLVNAIAFGKTAVVGMPQEDARFVDDISPERLAALNAEVKNIMLGVSNTLMKVASAIEDGVPKRGLGVVEVPIEVKG